MGIGYSAWCCTVMVHCTIAEIVCTTLDAQIHGEGDAMVDALQMKSISWPSRRLFYPFFLTAAPHITRCPYSHWQAKCKLKSAKCKMHCTWCDDAWCIGVRMKTTTCCSSLEKQGCVVVLTRLRVVFHIERVERHIKMISELICGLFWSPLYSAMEPSSIQPYPMLQKILCCVFVIES